MATVLRLAYLTGDVVHTALFSLPLLDEAEVVETAQRLLDGNGFGPEPFFRAPGYSLLVAAFMALFGDSWSMAIRVFQAILGGWVAGIAAATALKLSPGGRAKPLAGALAGFLLAIHGPAIRLDSTLSLDGPATALFAILAYGCVSFLRILTVGQNRSPILPSQILWFPTQVEAMKKLALMGGTALAGMSLLRPTVLPLIFILVPCFWILLGRRRLVGPLRLGLLALWMAPLILVLVAFLTRNILASGEWQIMPVQGSFNLREANRLDGPSGRYLIQRPVPELPSGNNIQKHPLVRALAERPSANPTREIAIREFLAATAQPGGPDLRGAQFGTVDRWHGQEFLRSLGSQPRAHLILYFQKLLELGSDREIFNYEDFSTQASRSPILAALAGRVGILLPLAALSVGFALILGRTWTPGRKLIWIAVSLLGISFAALTALGYSSGRMRMPLIVPMAMVAGTLPGLLGLALRSGRSPLPLFLVPVACGMIGTGMAWQDKTGVRSELTSYHDLGRMSNAAWHLGQRLEATIPVSKTSTTQDTMRNLAQAQDRYVEALVLARQARVLAPVNFPSPQRLEAQALSALSRGPSALKSWVRTAQLLPEDASVYQNLATTYLIDLGQPAESLPHYQKALELGSTESRAFLALAYLRLGRTGDAARVLEPLRPVLDQLAAKPLPPSANKPTMPISTRSVIAAIILAEAMNLQDRARALTTHLGPRGRAELLRESAFRNQQHTTPATPGSKP